MDHYLDIRLQPDPEFPSTVLMNALYNKFHMALVNLKSDRIGVSFPEVKNNIPPMGNRLRLHGTKDDLQWLQGENWLTGMRDHLAINRIAPVPRDAKHCRIRRVQPKSNAERMRRRYLKRHPETTEQEAAEKFRDSEEERVKLPFLQLKSRSNRNRFCLFIEHLPVQGKKVDGSFNSYGLSTQATVPWF